MDGIDVEDTVHPYYNFIFVTDHDYDVRQLRQRKLLQDDVFQVHGRFEGWKRLYPGRDGLVHG